jgi:hypothetical protein
MRTKSEIKQYQREYYQKVKKLKLDQEKRDKVKETYIISIVHSDEKSLIVEL